MSDEYKHDFSMILMYPGPHHGRRYEISQVFHNITKQRGESQAGEHAPQIRII